MSISFAEKKKQLDSLGNERDVNFILNESYRILENPIVMFDTSYNMLACAEGVVTDDWLWNEIVSFGTFSHETVDFFNTENFIMTFAKSQVVALMKSDKLKYDRMNGKLFDKDGVQLGDICIVACMKPFENGDMELVEILCEILSVKLRNSELYQKIDRVYQESVLNDLLDGKIRDNDVVKIKTAELLEQLKANLYLAVVDITQYDPTVTHLAYFRDLFRGMQMEYRYYIDLNNIVAILSTDHPLLSIKRDLSKFNEFFAKYKIYAGVSGCFHDLLDLRKHYREAVCALNYGLSGMRDQQIFMYDNCRVEHFLNSIKNTADISGIYSPAIFLILEYDRENETTLLKLLYIYLLYGKDAALTCKAMGISGNELNDQLKMLEDTFEIDWRDGDMLSNIFISLKMLDNLLS